MGTQRLFVAVDPPAYARDHLARFVGELHVARARARLAPPERWHVTVAFLGDVPEDRVVRVHDALTVAAGGPSAHPMTLRFAGGGRFGGRSGAVIWAGVAGEVERLRQLARAVGRELRHARFALDRRPYRPHLTISRPGVRIPREMVTADVAALAGYQGPDWPAPEIHLVRSYLGPDPYHERLASFPLG